MFCPFKGERMTESVNTGVDFLAEAEDPEFKALKRKRFSVVIPLSIAFLVWYFLYVILSTYTHDFMSTKVVGEINIGLFFGILQFVTTFAITMFYVSFANRKLDPPKQRIGELILHELVGCISGALRQSATSSTPGCTSCARLPPRSRTIPYTISRSSPPSSRLRCSSCCWPAATADSHPTTTMAEARSRV